MQKKILFLPIKWWIVLAVLLLATCICIIMGLHRFLAQTDRVEADVLVVEGWLPDYALEEAYKEFNAHPYKQMLTTGGPIGRDFRMYTSGKLSIDIPDSIAKKPALSPVVIQASGTEVDNIYPHFTVWVNDTICIGEAYTREQNNRFVFPVPQDIPAIQKVHIHYDNDGRKDEKDRDLYFRSLVVNNQEIDYFIIPAIYEFYSRNTKQEIVLSDKTMAQKAASYLKNMGLKEQEVIAISSPEVYRHRTYTSALALKEWLSTHDIKGVNIFSLGTHARRSRLSYEKVLADNPIEVGVIAVKNKQYNPDTWWQHVDTFKWVMREAVKYIYIQFFFDAAENIKEEGNNVYVEQ